MRCILHLSLAHPYALLYLSLHTFPCHPAFRQLFPAYETLVSPAWNFCFSCLKLWFHLPETLVSPAWTFSFICLNFWYPVVKQHFLLLETVCSTALFRLLMLAFQSLLPVFSVINSLCIEYWHPIRRLLISHIWVINILYIAYLYPVFRSLMYWVSIVYAFYPSSSVGW